MRDAEYAIGPGIVCGLLFALVPSAGASMSASSYVHIERMKADFGAVDNGVSGDWFGILLELQGGPTQVL